MWLGWLAVVVCALCADLTMAAAQEPVLQKKLAARVPLEELPLEIRERVRKVLKQPMICGHGPAEAFAGDPKLYRWLLDHPERAVLAWRRLGAQCTEITPRGGGEFAWTDGHGSEIRWKAIYDRPTLRIWFAEGKMSPGLLLPSVPVELVVVLRHGDRQDSNNFPLIYHQAYVFVQSDSRAAALTKRLLGPSAPRLAEQYLGQLEIFFSSLVWYCHQHPERSEMLLAQNQVPAQVERPALRPGH